MKITDITPENIKAYISGNNLHSRAQSLKPHEIEQVKFRAALCSDCLKAGKCRVCGCKTPQLFYARNKKDAEGKWGPMMDEKTWQSYKKSNEYKEKLEEYVIRVREFNRDHSSTMVGDPDRMGDEEVSKEEGGAMVDNKGEET